MAHHHAYLNTRNVCKQKLIMRRAPTGDCFDKYKFHHEWQFGSIWSVVKTFHNIGAYILTPKGAGALPCLHACIACTATLAPDSEHRDLTLI